MNNRIILGGQSDGESIRLSVGVLAGEYSGRSEAWFMPSQIEAFVAGLREFPISSDSPPRLEGGFWDVSGNQILQSHVAIEVVSRGTTGALALRVRVAVPNQFDEAQGPTHVCAADMPIEYQGLGALADGFESVASGRSSEFSLPL